MEVCRPGISQLINYGRIKHVEKEMSATDILIGAFPAADMDG